MLDEEGIFSDLDALGLDAWRETLAPVLRKRTADGAHGKLAEWRAVLDALDGDDVAANSVRVRQLLLELAPWRKGPFQIGDIEIDAEWRSDLKWKRVSNQISPLAGRSVLDVGCGNGYYAMQMLDAGASRVIGIDPTLLFVVQFAAVRKLVGCPGAHVLPLRLEDLPGRSHAFDTTFSMGVLYHRRQPAQHLDELLGTLKPGGELVLESLVLPGDSLDVLELQGRYARMRNVWHLPTVKALSAWLSDAGFIDVKLIDVSTTTCDEQRSTEWMPFDSLSEALDADDPSLTIEGLPAPTRAVFVCSTPQ